MKNCINCKHFYMHSGSPDYSEYTPGCDVSSGCSKNHWCFEPNNDTEDSYRAKVNKAETCKDFEDYLTS